MPVNGSKVIGDGIELFVKHEHILEMIQIKLWSVMRTQYMYTDAVVVDMDERPLKTLARLSRMTIIVS